MRAATYINLVVQCSRQRGHSEPHWPSLASRNVVFHDPDGEIGREAERSMAAHFGVYMGNRIGG
jgi:hypothetical protein